MGAQARGMLSAAEPPVRAPPPAETAGGEAQLTLLGRWELVRAGTPVEVSRNGQRLLSFLALSGVCDRDLVAGTLWPKAPERRAHGNLRSALWRLRREGADVVTATPLQLALCDTDTDVAGLVRYTNDLFDDPLASLDEDRFGLLAGPGLLPGWYEDWVGAERDRLDQLRLSTLEVVSDRLLTAGLPTPAAATAAAAVRIDPLRESPRRCLIRARIVDADVGAAVREYARYRDLLERELGVRPSERITALVAPYLRSGRTL